MWCWPSCRRITPRWRSSPSWCCATSRTGLRSAAPTASCASGSTPSSSTSRTTGGSTPSTASGSANRCPSCRPSEGPHQGVLPMTAEDSTEARHELGDVIIEMSGVSKWFDKFQALNGIDLVVRRGERIVICGPSGSGKSTLIRCLNRLEEHSQGRIVIDGIELDEATRHIEQVRREVGMVFQQFNLFPHLTVLENCILAPMKVRGMAKAEAET